MMLHRLERRAPVRVDASLDLPTRERGDPTLRHPAVGAAVPRIEVREHLLERHHAARAVVLAPEDDVRPAAYADRSMPAAVHAHPMSRDGVHEHTLEARARQEGDREEVIPPTEPADVLVCRRAIAELEQRRRAAAHHRGDELERQRINRKSTRLNSSHLVISYAV